MLDREFQTVSTTAGIPTVRVMTWNILSQGKSSQRNDHLFWCCRIRLSLVWQLLVATIPTTIIPPRYRNTGRDPARKYSFFPFTGPLRGSFLSLSLSLFSHVYFYLTALSTAKDNFVRCPPAALHWEHRRLKIIEEILAVSPDIACFQVTDNRTEKLRTKCDPMLALPTRALVSVQAALPHVITS